MQACRKEEFESPLKRNGKFGNMIFQKAYKQE